METLPLPVNSYLEFHDKYQCILSAFLYLNSYLARSIGFYPPSEFSSYIANDGDKHKPIGPETLNMLFY